MRRPTHITAPKALFLGLTGALVFWAGCAWGYAGQTDERPEAETERDRDPNLVEVRDETDDEAGDEGADDASRTRTDSPGEPEGGDQAACDVETFEIHYFDDSNQITKEIHCARREVLDVKRNSIQQQKLRSAEQSGLPKATWYLLVDPKGVRSAFLDNDQLIRISQEYDLQFLGRDENRDLLIYEYRGDL